MKMNRDELKIKLDELGVKEQDYSLIGELNADTMILYPNYSKWEVFYMDERGGRNDYHVFFQRMRHVSISIRFSRNGVKKQEI